MNSPSRVAVIGAGGHACVVASIIMATGHKVVGFYDDDEEKWGSHIFGIPVVGAIDQLMSETNFSHGIIAIGQNEIRKSIAEKLDIDWITNNFGFKAPSF